LTWLASVGFVSAVFNPCVFFHLNDNAVWLFFHVNDIAVFNRDLLPFKIQIKTEFDMKELGKADMLLSPGNQNSPQLLVHHHDSTPLCQLTSGPVWYD
jgi:hypothetical protein